MKTKFGSIDAKISFDINPMSDIKSLLQKFCTTCENLNYIHIDDT